MSERINLEDLNEEQKNLYALEALLKRISLVSMPFVLKGSRLTRQYFENKEMRNAKDIDFLYARKINDEEGAYEIFTKWLIQATDKDLNDGVVFRLKDEIDWEEFQYGMADDFPTTSIEVPYQLKDESEKLRGYGYLKLDISFNFQMTIQPVPLEYSSDFFGKFLLPYTTPLSIQVAWKLHQTIVRPRFKDLYDLRFLLSHPSYDEQAIKETLQELVNECSFDYHVTKENIKRVLVNDLYGLFPALRYDTELRVYADGNDRDAYYKEFVTELRQVMDNAGINQDAFDNLPNPK